ncbi:MAG: hypothetical protein DHS20C01_36250 [marine bacterium B5-7]|nr:MAG: hypothetical protein DHS20C01_36250 [marine bacterium B5-7]
MICKFCDKDKKLCKSHIIPESFFKFGHVANDNPYLISNKNDHHPQRRPIGEYDNSILCANCENVFSVWEQYGKEILLDRFQEFSEIVEDGQPIGSSLTDWNYGQLKLFCLSVVWRASVSTQPMFKKVNLGPHDEQIRKLLASRNPTDPDDYAISIFRFTGVDYGLPTLMPLKIRSTYGLIFYRIYWGDFFFDIKVDKQRTPEKYTLGTLIPGEALIIYNRNIRESREYDILRKIARHNENKGPFKN